MFLDKTKELSELSFLNENPLRQREVENTDKKIYRLIHNIIHSIGNFFYQFAHKFTGFIILPSQLFFKSFLKEKRDRFVSCSGEEVDFYTSDNIKLNGIHFLGKDCKPNDRTLILFNSNAVAYEQYGFKEIANSLLYDINSWKDNQWNVFLFNYRGVGKSKGVATRKGLIQDGDAAYKYVKEHLNVPDNKILLHGHCFGAAIASEVAALHPDINLCIDRSFLSLSKQIQYGCLNELIGSIFSKTVTKLGWEYETFKSLEKINGKTIFIFHESDSIVNVNFRENFKSLCDQSISLTPCWTKHKYSSLSDDIQLINERIMSLKNRGAMTIKQKINFFFKKLEYTRIAHMRKFNENDLASYFQIINTI
ncbi:MAG: hypothetical protein Tsb0021_05430 [Chlamydiales bacterium]